MRDYDVKGALGFASRDPAGGDEDDDHADGAERLDGNVQEDELVQSCVDDLEICDRDGSTCLFSLKAHGQQDLSGETEDADTNEEQDPLWLCWQHKLGACGPHEQGADNGRVERKVGDRVGRRCSTADGTDGDVGSCTTTDTKQCQTDSE